MASDIIRLGSKMFRIDISKPPELWDYSEMELSRLEYEKKFRQNLLNNRMARLADYHRLAIPEVMVGLAKAIANDANHMQWIVSAIAEY